MNDQHSMNPDVARKLLQVGEAFRIPGPFFSYEEIKMGNVNHTYKVNYIRDDGTGMARIKSYLVQRVNTYAFQHPVELMRNIDRVTEHIRTIHPETKSLHFHHTADGNNYLMDEDGFWRLSNYVPSVTFDTCDDLNVVRSAGQAFGDFQMLLSDFDAEQLFYTIPDFHNTRKRYEKLKADIVRIGNHVRRDLSQYPPDDLRAVFVGEDIIEVRVERVKAVMGHLLDHAAHAGNIENADIAIAEL